MADDIAQAVSEKQRKDEFETAELITRGTPSVVARKGVDGGMHRAVRGENPEWQHRPLGSEELFIRRLFGRAGGAADRQPAGFD